MTAPVAAHDGAGTTEQTRRNQILEIASVVFAASGFRTSLKEIADACGILPGSLYHHFASKEAIIVELVDRYHSDLDAIAARADAQLPVADGDELVAHVVALATDMAACAMRHRAAAAMTLFEPPSGATEQLLRSLAQPPTAIEAAVDAALRSGEGVGAVRSGLDLPSLSHRLCYSMLSLAAGVPDGRSSGDRTSEVKARLVLLGLAVDAPDDDALDRSPARAAADAAIATWVGDEEGEDERVAALRAAARAEFARRGYASTTVRDIATAAGTSTGSVYRLIGSKDELLLSVMRSFTQNISAGWEAVLDSPATATEKLDALMWVDIEVLRRYRDEFRIQLAGLRYSPSSLAEVGWSFSRRLDEVRMVIDDGVRDGELVLPDAAGDDAAWAVLELMWMPESIVADGGHRAMALGRASLLRGVTVRR